MSENFEKYMKTYYGRNLSHSLDTQGLWRVRGEDPNCDFGGAHYMPELGVYEGKLRDVIEMAAELKSFWTWGSGGDFTLITPKKVDTNTNKRNAELLKEKQELEARIKEINKELV